MYKKPAQPQTPSISSNKKNVRVTEKVPLAPIDRKNDTNHTEFKNKDEQLLAMVKEYLQFSGYMRSYETLKTEKPNIKAKVQLNQSHPKTEADKNHIVQLFERGGRDEFFRQTLKLFQNPDDPTRKFQFELNIYFCIYNIHPHLKKQPSIDKASADAFKKYLDTKGADLSETSQFLSFFALPFMPKPQEHKALAHVFTKEWLSKIRNKLAEFLANHLRSSNAFNQIPPNSRKVSQLQELYHNSLSSVNLSRDECKQNCNHSIEIDNLKKQNNDLRLIIENYQKKFEQFSQSSKMNLIQSNQKWFNFSREIFVIAKRYLRQDKVKMIDKYTTFFIGNIDELIEANEISLFDKNSYINEDLSIAPEQSKQRIAKRQETASQNYQIDLARIRNAFLMANHKDKELEICMVLRALKYRFTRKTEAVQRREIIIEYSRGDICGINEENYIVQKKLLFDGGEKIKILYLKLMEIITTDVLGLQYLTKSKKLVENLVGIFNIEHEDSRCRKPVLGILQRVSFSKEPRMLMINLGIIPMMFNIFKREAHQISNFTIQFLIAMWMNLSLKRESYPYFEQHKSELISIVIEQMTSPNDNIRNYVNGTIFLLLSSKQIKLEALKQRLDQFVKHLLDSKEDTMCTQQYNYILNRLSGQEDEELCQNEDSEDQEEADGEQFEDEEYGALSESSQEDFIEGDMEIANGQQFLSKNYALLGPEAMREQLLTRSVLDETSKRLNNMTTSINRSRRLDNIFVGKGNATVLQPQLDCLLNRKK